MEIEFEHGSPANKHGQPSLDLNNVTVLLGSCDMVKEIYIGIYEIALDEKHTEYY